MPSNRPITPIIHSALLRRDSAAVALLLASGADPDERDRTGRTPLIYACADGDLPLAGALIRRGASVNAQDRGGWTALHFAAQEYRPELVHLLVQSGADLSLRDENGNSPLWVAVMHSRGRTEVARLLLEHGADPDQANNYGVSARAIASSNESLQTLLGRQPRPA
jgi:ankyrin repeat protein